MLMYSRLLGVVVCDVRYGISNYTKLLIRSLMLKGNVKRDHSSLSVGSSSKFSS